MAPVPRKPDRPMSYENCRGVLCANAAAKVVARVMRQEILPPLLPALRGWQYGAVPAGGTEIPSHAVRTFLAEGVATLSSVATFSTFRP